MNFHNYNRRPIYIIINYLSFQSASSNNNNTGCKYYNNRKSLDHNSLPSAFDLNILRKKGEELTACPYYAARYMKENANIVFCPYNFLIDPTIRNSVSMLYYVTTSDFPTELKPYCNKQGYD